MQSTYYSRALSSLQSFQETNIASFKHYHIRNAHSLDSHDLELCAAGLMSLHLTELRKGPWQLCRPALDLD